LKNRYTYTAREYDTETSLYFYRARYYDPKAGRFISKDPIGFGGGINVFAYVLNNPINKVDPLGLYETLFGQHYFEGADGWSWYGGWPWNGSLWPGYSSQDNICTWPDRLGGNYLNNNKCTKSCCVKHDNCYTKFGCNATSWIPIWIGPIKISGPCQMCNDQLLGCLNKNVGKSDCECNGASGG
jgi:RHS repeat-associated protein